LSEPPTRANDLFREETDDPLVAGRRLERVRGGSRQKIEKEPLPPSWSLKSAATNWCRVIALYSCAHIYRLRAKLGADARKQHAAKRKGSVM
jgi:hypothetical protein